MIFSIARRFVTQIKPQQLLRFSWHCGWKNMIAIQQFQKRLKKGVHFPAFLFVSVTNRCNLKCQGCWVIERQENLDMDMAQLDKIITESKALGIHFFGILGGEPMLFKPLFEVLQKHQDCYFLMFTNGTMLNEESTAQLAKMGNVTPLVSIEGRESVSDIRRGGSGVYRRSWDGLRHSVKSRMITGVATSVCKSNFKDLVSEAFIDELISEGVLYMWYYIYRPVGANPVPELALSEDEILELREFIVHQRTRKAIVLVDAYWDHEGKALCPAATGISHHVNPQGFVEPCPPIQFARDQITPNEPLFETVVQSSFLKSFRQEITANTRGCVLMEDPTLLCDLVESEGATDTSARACGLNELKQLQKVPGHDMPGKEIPERSWFYRFAKKHWFFGFGAYG